MWFDKEAPEEAQIPGGYNMALDSFRKLLLIRYSSIVVNIITSDIGIGVLIVY